MHATGDRETVLRLAIDHRVATGDDATRLVHLVDAATEQRLELLH